MKYLEYFGYVLISWWACSFWIVIVDYIQGRITMPWLFIGEMINFLTFSFILHTLRNYNQPLPDLFIVLGFILILWFAHYTWVDYQSPYMKPWLRWLYGTIDLMTCLYICLIVYRNTGLMIKMTKDEIICGLEQLMNFAQCIFRA